MLQMGLLTLIDVEAQELECQRQSLLDVVIVGKFCLKCVLDDLCDEGQGQGQVNWIQGNLAAEEVKPTEQSNG